MKEETPDNIKNELKEVAPFLASLTKKSMDAPVTYFEQLPLTITDRIIAEKNSKVGFWNIILKPHFAVAGVAACLVMGFYIFKSTSSQQESIAFSGVAVQSLSDDVILTQVDESYLADALDDNNATTNGVDETEEDYLIDNNTELNTIINEL